MHLDSIFTSALLLSLVGCGDQDDADTAPVDTTPTWHQDVRPLLERSCLGCHQDTQSLSGIPLDTYERAAGMAEFIGSAVSSRTMPPWSASDDCNTYQGSLALSDDEIAMVEDWVAAGTPEGDANEPAPTAEGLDLPSLERVDLTLEMPVDYTPTDQPDDYRCFLLEWPYEETMYVTGYDVRAGNEQTVHHVIPFIIAPGDVDAYRALEAEDPEDGYDCYGGPGGDIDTLIDTRWLGSWAPGGGASVFPEGAGVDVAPGSVIALQMHYYISEEDPAPDRTSIDLQISDSVELGSEIQPWTNVSWLFGDGMDIPANTEGVSHSFSYTLSSRAWDIQSAAVHMHSLGRSATLRAIHADGTETCILDVPDYDFNWQRSYRLQEPVAMALGDTLELTCVWDNDTDQDVAWGDGTGDEMCLGVTLLTWD